MATVHEGETTMKRSLTAAAALAALSLAAPAAAQKEPAVRLPDTIKLPDGIKRPDLRPAGAEPLPVTVRGCIVSETFNTQSATDYSMQFRIRTATGFEMFNFTRDYIVRADPASFTLATREDTMRWTRIMDALERAAQEQRTIDVSYDDRNQRVFGISINWNEDCLP
jgi:hypothetical protein